MGHAAPILNVPERNANLGRFAKAEKTHLNIFENIFNNLILFSMLHFRSRTKLEICTLIVSSKVVRICVCS